MRKLALLGITALILSGCSLGGGTPAPTTAPTETSTIPDTTQVSPAPSGSPAADATSLVPDANTRVVEVSGLNFSFAPNVINAKVGEKLAVKFTNTEGFHDFVIDELNVKSKTIPQGTSDTVMIPTDKAGTYEFFCSVSNHRQKGMVGKLIIE